MSAKGTLSIYTAAHFCVDFACFFLLFCAFVPRQAPAAAMAGLLLYNVVAFGLQPVVGYWQDARPGLPAAFIGCVLLLAGLGLSAAGPAVWAALFLAALGNAFFHVGGGVDSLVRANGKTARSGVFVSSGALGVSLGTLAGGEGWGLFWLPLVLVVLCCAGTLAVWLARHRQQAGAAVFGIVRPLPVAMLLALCFAAVVVRALAGGMLAMPWRAGGTLLWLLPGIMAFAGKASGGFLADRFGARPVGMLSLAASAPLLWFGGQNVVCGAVGVFLFNITMPIVLCAIADVLPRNPGLAFGLNCLGLLAGSVPLFFFVAPAWAARLAVALLTVAALGCVGLCLRAKRVRAAPGKAGRAPAVEASGEKQSA